MKTKTILFLFLLCSAMLSAQVKRVAVLETVDKENKVSYASKLILRTSLSKAIANLPDCEVYDRTDIDAIMSEHTFQRSGLVSNDQIKRLGEMTGAEYILVAEAVKVNAKNLFVTAKLLDVETARTIVTEMMEINMEHMQQGCNALVKKMFPDKKEFDFGTKAVGPQLIRNSKSDQRLFGVGAYSYGETQMDKKALEAFLRNNSPQAYKKYMRGRNSIAAGWTFFTVGLLATATGGAFMTLAETVYRDKLAELNSSSVNMYTYSDNWGEAHFERLEYWRDYSDEFLNALPQAERAWYEAARSCDKQYDLFYWCGIGLLSAGGGLTVVSIPLLAGGYSTKDNAYKEYSVSPKEKNKLTLNLQSSMSGVGLALNF